MREQLESRLIALKQEFELGQRTLLDIERQATHLRETLLRISGAIQVIEELLSTQEREPTSEELVEHGPMK